MCCHVTRYVPSQADMALFGAVGGAPTGNFVNALRWYNQINSYSADEQLTWVLCYCTGRIFGGCLKGVLDSFLQVYWGLIQKFLLSARNISVRRWGCTFWDSVYFTHATIYKGLISPSNYLMHESYLVHFNTENYEQLEFLVQAHFTCYQLNEYLDIGQQNPSIQLSTEENIFFCQSFILIHGITHYVVKYCSTE